ncbi:MAG: FAD-dependent oxidoreductase [Salinarimonadaceae bacterium]|nr:MAG: FAD-dependent oxidoreductase [Salinarimonadaceae bacterium]
MAFDFEGVEVPALPGDTVAAALERAGLRALRRARPVHGGEVGGEVGGEDRGVFCGMGICQDCLVEIDGRASQRACMTKADGVARVARHRDGEGMVGSRLADPPPEEGLPLREVDLAIVGAGPAGASAAIAASGAGLRVVLVDERASAGGQYFKAPAGSARLDAQHRAGEALRERLAACDVERLSGCMVWHARRDGEAFSLGLYGDGRATLLSARALVIATGAYEKPAIFPGWTLPGIMTIGAAQTYIRSHGVAPGGSVAVASHGPLGLQLAHELILAGWTPLALLERGRPSRVGNLGDILAALSATPGHVARGAAARFALMRAGAPVMEGWEVVAARGEGRLEEVEIAALDGTARRTLALDTLCVGDGFLPQNEIARSLGCPCRFDPATGALLPERDAEGRTPIAGLWIAGDGGGLGGADAAMAQGTLAGLAAREMLGAAAAASGKAEAARRDLSRARRFQNALWRIYAAPPRAAPTEGTIICRCEKVTAGAVRGAIASGACDLGAVKRLTRLGMGRCQGRYCAGEAMRFLGDYGDPLPGFAPQSPLRPVPAAAIAHEKPEWGGHRQAPSPPLRAPSRIQAPPLPEKTELLVIGAGIMGASAALRAARLGVETLVVDAGPVNREASGGNAGSLHLQLLSFDFGAKTGGRGKALLQTLPLQKESIALWNALQEETDVSFEISVTGGMMLAEESDQIAFLRDKVAAEAEVGIESYLIGRNEIGAIAPGVSDRMIAAAWCPGEGKVNPLVATPAIAAAAREAGARFEHGALVEGITRDGESYLVATSRGTVRTERLVLCAGAWTGALARMLGVDLPISGAPLQMVVTETAPPLASCLLAHSDRHLTMKQAEAGNLIIGGAWSAVADPATGRTRTLRDSIEGNVWVAERVIPAVSGLHVLRSWAAMNVDIDGAPMIGPLPGHPRCAVAAGANGYTLGPLVGYAAAESVVKGALGPEYAAFRVGRAW